MNNDFKIRITAEFDSAQAKSAVQQGLDSIKNEKVKIIADSSQVKSATTQMKKLNNEAKEGITIWNQLGYQWKKAFASFTMYSTVTTVFYQSIAAIRAMVTEVADLDAALVELRKVTDLSGSSLEEFTQKAYNAAATVAKTGTDMVDAATEFAKAGYSEDDILELGRIALMYTNIADEEVAVGDSANFMIAQMKAFNIEAEDAMHIIDAVNEVANRFAVSSADIANNLGNSSAVMANAGNSYEEMIGLLTAGTEITRNASKVSNGLKTITLRMQGMNDEGEKDLELVAQMQGLYNKLGISVYDSNGELKNTFELLKTLAPVYQEATAAEKAYITETIAGKYQAQNAAAILNNFETAIKATETAMNSNGSAMRENSVYLDSIEGKFNQLKSAFEELSNAIISSDLVKWFIDLGTAILKVANSDFGSFIVKATAFVAIINLLNKGFIGLQGGLSSLGNYFVSLISGAGKAGTSVYKLAAANQVLSKSYTLVKTGAMTSMTGLTATQGAMGALSTTTGATSGIMGVLGSALKSLISPLGLATGAVLLGINAYQNYTEAIKESIQAVSEDASTLEAEAQNIDDTIARVQTLRDTLDDNNVSYKDAQAARKELMEIQKSLKEEYGEEAENINLVTGSITDQIEELRKLKQERAQDYLDDNRTGYENAKDDVYGKNKYTRSMLVGTTYQDARDYDYAVKNKEMSKEEAKVYEERRKNAENFNKDIKQIIEKYAIKGTVDDSMGAGFFGFTTENVDKSKKLLESLKKYYQDNEKEILKQGFMSQDEFNTQLGYIDTELQNIEKKYGESYQAIADYNEKMKDAAGWESFSDELQDMASTTVLTEDNIQKLIDKYPGLDEALDANNIKVKDLKEDYQNLDTVYEDILGKNEGLAEELGKISLDGTVTEDELNGLKEKFPELQDEIENTGYSLEDFVDKFPDFIYSASADMDTLIDQMNSIQNAYNIATAAMEEYNEVGYFSIDTLEQLLTLKPQYLDAIVDENGVIRDNISMFKALANAKLDEMLASENDRYMKELNRLATMSEAEAAQLAAASIDAHNAAMAGQEVNAAALRAQIQANIEAFDKEAAAALKAAAAKNEAEHNQKVALIENTRTGLGKNWKYSLGGSSSSSKKKTTTSTKNEKEWWETELEKLKDQFDYNEITIEEYINGLSGLLGKLQQGTEAWKKVNEELQKQRLNKVEDDYKRGVISVDEYINKLKELAKAYKQGTEAWNELADKIKEGLQDKLDKQKDDLETAEDAAIGLIDEEIEKLEELRDAEEERYDKLIEEKEKANEETEKEIELARLQEALENAKNEKTKRVECMLSIKMAQNGETPEEDNTVGKICFEI